MQLSSIAIFVFLVISLLTVVIPSLVENFPNHGKAGIFKSYDSGFNWFSRANTANISSLERKDILDVGLNAQNPQNLFIGTRKDGLYASFDYGESWTRITDYASKLSPQATVNKVVIDNLNQLNIYLAAFQDNYGHVFKSKDGGRSFDIVFTTAGQNQKVLTLAINNKSPNLIYLGTSSGGFFESTDYGTSWKILKWFDSPVNIIYLSKGNSQDIYIGTDNGLFKTTNQGRDFSDLSKNLNKINSSAAQILTINGDPKDSKIIYVGTHYGILKSTDSGFNFKPMKILIEPNLLPIEVIEVNPKDGKIIYVGAKSLLYKSIDGGLSWSVEKLPTLNSIQAIKINQVSSQEIYLGVGKNSF